MLFPSLPSSRVVHSAVMMLVVFHFSCMPARKAIMLNDLSQGIDSVNRNAIEFSKRLYPGDRLSINIFYPNPGEILLEGQGGGGSTQQGQAFGYLVDQNGLIDIVGLGVFRVVGLTTTELANEIKKRLSGLYKDAFVRCQYIGRVLFLGGAGMQGSIPIGEEQMSVIQALALRGINDPTLRRDRVWIIRETDGIREYGLVNLTKKNVYTSPYFYLRNNDIVYVEPNKTNAFLNINAPTRNIFSIISSSLALAFSLWFVFR
jgi:polysaccharide export outer membrane protein